MKKPIIILSAVSLFVTPASSLYAYAGEEHEDMAQPQATSAQAPATSETKPAAGEKGKALYYRNPMNMSDTSPVPKKDSMGMDYIPVYAPERKSTQPIPETSPADQDR